MKGERSQKRMLFVVFLACPFIAVAVEAIRCQSGALPGVVRASTLTTYSQTKEHLGAPDEEDMLDSSAVIRRGAFGVTLPEAIGSAVQDEKIRISVWNRRCFLVSEHRLVMFSSPSGRVIFIGGYSRNAFPIVVSSE